LRTTYGLLDEVLSVSAEIGDDVWATESYGYDAALNRTSITSPEGEQTLVVYDNRNLPVRVETGRPDFDPPVVELRTFDGERRLKTVTDPRNQTAETDSYRRPASAVDALGNLTSG